MRLDDVHGDDFDEIPPGQEAAWPDREPPELEWDESDASLAVDDLLGRSQRCSHDYSQG
jgi:hypothetical protein